MSREQMKKLLSEPTNEERLIAENEELHRIAEQATERGQEYLAELERLRKDNDEMRNGPEGTEVRVRLSETRAELILAHRNLRDQEDELERLREENKALAFEGVNHSCHDTLKDDLARLRSVEEAAREHLGGAEHGGVGHHTALRAAFEEKP